MGLCMLDAPGDKGTGELVVGKLAARDQRFGQGDARDLRHDRLVVHQGHVEEQRLDHAAVAGCVCVWMVWMMVVVVVVDVNDMDEPVEFARDRRHRDPACLCVGGVRLLRVPVDVAGELVQQEEQREAALGRVGPVVELVGARLRHECAEARADLLVEAVAAAEPFLAGRGVREPEGQDLADFGVHLVVE